MNGFLSIIAISDVIAFENPEAMSRTSTKLFIKSFSTALFLAAEEEL